MTDLEMIAKMRENYEWTGRLVGDPSVYVYWLLGKLVVSKSWREGFKRDIPFEIYYNYENEVWEIVERNEKGEWVVVEPTLEGGLL